MAAIAQPALDVVMKRYTAAQLRENLAEAARGPLAPDEREWMRRFGDAVRARHNFFM